MISHGYTEEVNFQTEIERLWYLGIWLYTLLPETSKIASRYRNSNSTLVFQAENGSMLEASRLADGFTETSSTLSHLKASSRPSKPRKAERYRDPRISINRSAERKLRGSQSRKSHGSRTPPSGLWLLITRSGCSLIEDKLPPRAKTSRQLREIPERRRRS